MDTNEPDPPPADVPQGDPAPSDAGAPQTLGLLFFAAAGALALLLAVIGVVAFLAMAK